MLTGARRRIRVATRHDSQRDLERVVARGRPHPGLQRKDPVRVHLQKRPLARELNGQRHLDPAVAEALPEAACVSGARLNDWTAPVG